MAGRTLALVTGEETREEGDGHTARRRVTHQWVGSSVRDTYTETVESNLPVRKSYN